MCTVHKSHIEKCNNWPSRLKKISVSWPVPCQKFHRNANHPFACCRRLMSLELYNGCCVKMASQITPSYRRQPRCKMVIRQNHVGHNLGFFQNPDHQRDISADRKFVAIGKHEHSHDTRLRDNSVSEWIGGFDHEEHRGENQHEQIQAKDR